MHYPSNNHAVRQNGFKRAFNLLTRPLKALNLKGRSQTGGGWEEKIALKLSKYIKIDGDRL